MKRTRFSGLVLITLIVTIVWVAPLYATGDPWDGTKYVDTLEIGGGDAGINSGENPDVPDGGDGTLLGSVLKWLQDTLGLTNDKSNTNHQDLRRQGTKIKNRKNYDPIRNYKLKE